MFLSSTKIAAIMRFIIPFGFFAVIYSSVVCAADRVTYRSGDAEKTVVGEITEWTGNEIAIRNTLGREATLPMTAILDVQSPKTPMQRTADASYDAGEYAKAGEFVYEGG